MPKQALIFPDLALQPLRVITESGPVTVNIREHSYPIAIHDSTDAAGPDQQQSVTHIPSGYAFRTQMTLEAARALSAALVAGLGSALWKLDWLLPKDMDSSEQTALLTEIGSHQDDYWGFIEVSPALDGLIVLCNQDTSRPSYSFDYFAPGPTSFGPIEPGIYDAYYQQGGLWSPATVGLVVPLSTSPVPVTFGPVAVENPPAPCA